MKRNLFSFILPRLLMLLLVIILAFAISSCELFSQVFAGVDGDEDGDDEDDTPVTLEADQFESNNTWQEAAGIELDTEYSVNLETNDDIDFYSFTTDHGSDTYDKVEFDLGCLSTDLLFHFEIYNTSGEELLSDTASTSGQNFIYTASCPGGTYLFRVSGWNGVMDYDNGSHGAYTVKVFNLDVNDAQAPNQGINDAATVEFGTSYPAVIVSEYEDDWYSVENTENDQWNIFQLELTDVSTTLAAGYYIFDADKNEIYASNGANSSFDTGSNQTYSFALKSSKFYFKICGWDNVMHSPHGSTGSYTFTIINQNANDDYEPDDTLAEAQEIIVPTSGSVSKSGTIVVESANDNGGDFEWFKVTIKDDTKISWSADPVDTNTELHFNVYNASETYLGQEDGDDGQTINGTMDNTSGEDSFFYIELGGYVGNTGDYTIEFTETSLL